MRRKRKEVNHESDISEAWLIPYADILTLLLALFVILFASSQIDQRKYQQIMESFNSALTGGTGFFERSEDISIEDTLPDTRNLSISAMRNSEEFKELLQRENRDMRAIKAEIDRYITENDLSAQLQTRLNEEMLVIQIQDFALFDSASAVVKPESQRLAQKIGEMLMKYPDYNVEVAGHTDNLPINNAEFSSNWELSAHRSLNFMMYLLNNNNLNPARFRTIGYGEYSPIASNDTEEGRSRNRRVEVNIIRNTTQLQHLALEEE